MGIRLIDLLEGIKPQVHIEVKSVSHNFHFDGMCKDFDGNWKEVSKLYVGSLFVHEFEETKVVIEVKEANESWL